ncbi:MAG: T9SS type A sorting domain-containing protein [Candidatus Latescibacteria bacterium]|nr:T9SS type A sorting domain-containing protein [Candidatus Latescibacterota bacterium]
MKTKPLLIALILLMGLGAVAEATPPPVYQGQAILGPGLNSGRTGYSQTWNRTLSPDTLYTLTGLYYVENGYTLTIPAGTVCQADTAATLIITRGAKIYAEGTAEQPIVFTSRKLEGQRAPGDWGGVMILGRAPVNKVDPLIEGGIIGGTYGGSNPNDDSGVFKYVRIEYCGYRFQLNNEVNGLTMGGVGAGTEIHHVQVSYSFDDGYEWFGGTVNCDHLVCFGVTDDEFDTDFGFTGNVQFAFGIKDLNLWDPTGETNGFESDNDGSSTSQATPFTHPHFSNVTLIGPERTDALVGNLPVGHKFQHAAVLRRSTRTSIYNSVIMGYPWGMSIRDAFTQASALTDVLQVRNLSLQASVLEPGSATVHDEGRWAGVVTWYNTPAYANTGTAPRNPSAIGLTDLSDLNNPNPVPAAGSELIGTADFSAPALAGFAVTTYRGAFDPALPMDQQWTAGWTNFNPQGTAYVTAVGDGPAAAPHAVLASYPNPFNPSTAVRFSVPRSGHVSLKAFDMRGREVAVLVDGNVEAGEHTTVFAPSGLSSGTYFLRLSGSGFTQNGTVQLVK